MNASFLLERRSMRVLSPSMLPREMLLVGSTASTATRLPLSQSILPKHSINVLLPAPGTPVMPTRTLFPVWGKMRRIISCPNAKCFSELLSTMVMACAKMRRLPLSTP